MNGICNCLDRWERVRWRVGQVEIALVEIDRTGVQVYEQIAFQVCQQVLQLAGAKTLPAAPVIEKAANEFPRP